MDRSRQGSTRPTFPLTREEWDMLLGDASATMDFPTAVFMPELIAAYPEAKVIVAERPVDKWWPSFRSAVNAMRDYLALPLAFLDGQFFSRWFRMSQILMSVTFGPKGFEEQNVRHRYKELHEEVRSLVPAERRLEFQLGDGWKLLCDFLGKEVPPNVDFPWVNERGLFDERSRVARNLAWERVSARWAPWLISGFVAVGAAVFWWSAEGIDRGKLMALVSRS